MDELLRALGPAFASGFAIQRLLEILDPLFEKIKFVTEYKKVVFGLLSLISGLLLAIFAGLRILAPLGMNVTALLDIIVTALVVSAGTDGINSFLKWLGYNKEEQKYVATQKEQGASPQAVEQIQKVV
jgi:uncharacterized protein YacL